MFWDYSDSYRKLKNVVNASAPAARAEVGINGWMEGDKWEVKGVLLTVCTRQYHFTAGCKGLFTLQRLKVGFAKRGLRKRMC